MGISFDPKSQIRVVRIIARLNIGGPAIHAILLTQYLPKEKFIPVLVAGSVGASEGDMLPYAQARQVDPVLIPELGREISWGKDLIALWRLMKILRTVKPHIVHTHTAKAGLLGRFAAWVVGVPIRVHTFHGHIFHGYFSSVKTKTFLILERLMAKVTHAIIAVSESQRQELAKTYRVASESDIQVIPLGFDLDPFHRIPLHSANEEVAAPPDTFKVGFVGRLVPIKNPFLLVQAIIHFMRMQEIQRDDTIGPSTLSSLHVSIVGEGELSEALRHEVARVGLEDTVKFLGWRRDMASIYAELHVVVLTSNNEGTPVALIEAMASGKPFIATNVGGIKDLMVGPGKPMRGEHGGLFTLFDNGILVEAYDVEGISCALDYAVAGREQCSQMGKVGRAFAVQHFGKDRLVSDMTSLYQRLLVSTG